MYYSSELYQSIEHISPFHCPSKILNHGITMSLLLQCSYFNNSAILYIHNTTCQFLNLLDKKRPQQTVNISVSLSLHSRVTESRDVDWHVSGTPQERSHDQVTLQQLHTIGPPLRVTGSEPISNRLATSQFL